MIRFAVGVLLLAGSSALADVWTFETPSENIQCSVGVERNHTDIRCTIIQRNGAPAMPRPANCGSDWGHVFDMANTGRVQMICGPLNRNRDGYERAEYGVTSDLGGIVCSSSRKGLECRNESGHGFFLSRAVQRVF